MTRLSTDLQAWVDESMTSSDGESFYVMAATRLQHGDLLELRRQLEGLRVGRQPRLHWRDESGLRRRRVVEKIAALTTTTIVVVAAPMDPKKHVRARVQCLEFMLPTLEQDGVVKVAIERRTQSLNARDEATVRRMRSAGTISRHLEVSWEGPLDEPMLWIPDVVAGAAAAGLRGEPQWIDALASVVTQHKLELR